MDISVLWILCAILLIIKIVVFPAGELLAKLWNETSVDYESYVGSKFQYKGKTWAVDEYKDWANYYRVAPENSIYRFSDSERIKNDTLVAIIERERRPQVETVQKPNLLINIKKPKMKVPRFIRIWLWIAAALLLTSLFGVLNQLAFIGVTFLKVKLGQ